MFYSQWLQCSTTVSIRNFRINIFSHLSTGRLNYLQWHSTLLCDFQFQKTNCKIFENKEKWTTIIVPNRLFRTIRFIIEFELMHVSKYNHINWQWTRPLPRCYYTVIYYIILIHFCHPQIVAWEKKSEILIK